MTISLTDADTLCRYADIPCTGEQHGNDCLNCPDFPTRRKDNPCEYPIPCPVNDCEGWCKRY